MGGRTQLAEDRVFSMGLFPQAECGAQLTHVSGREPWETAGQHGGAWEWERVEALPEGSPWLSFQLSPTECHSSARPGPLGPGRKGCRLDQSPPLLAPGPLPWAGNLTEPNSSLYWPLQSSTWTAGLQVTFTVDVSRGQWQNSYLCSSPRTACGSPSRRMQSLGWLGGSPACRHRHVAGPLLGFVLEASDSAASLSSHPNQCRSSGPHRYARREGHPGGLAGGRLVCNPQHSAHMCSASNAELQIH